MNNTELDLFFDTLSSLTSQFIIDSQGIPIVKNLKDYGEVNRVKIRKRKKPKDRNLLLLSLLFEETFNFKDILERALIVHGSSDKTFVEEHTIPYYLFPVNGYRFLYNTTITDYRSVYDIINTLTKNTKNIDEHFLKKILKDLYTNDDLAKGLESKCEIIFYNIPFYIVIKKSLIVDYNKFYQELLTEIKRKELANDKN